MPQLHFFLDMVDRRFLLVCDDKLDQYQDRERYFHLTSIKAQGDNPAEQKVVDAIQQALNSDDPKIGFTFEGAIAELVRFTYMCGIVCTLDNPGLEVIAHEFREKESQSKASPSDEPT